MKKESWPPYKTRRPSAMTMYAFCVRYLSDFSKHQRTHRTTSMRYRTIRLFASRLYTYSMIVRSNCTSATKRLPSPTIPNDIVLPDSRMSISATRRDLFLRYARTSPVPFTHRPATAQPDRKHELIDPQVAEQMEELQRVQKFESDGIHTSPSQVLTVTFGDDGSRRTCSYVNPIVPASAASLTDR